MQQRGDRDERWRSAGRNVDGVGGSIPPFQYPARAICRYSTPSRTLPTASRWSRPATSKALPSLPKRTVNCRADRPLVSSAVGPARPMRRLEFIQQRRTQARSSYSSATYRPRPRAVRRSRRSTITRCLEALRRPFSNRKAPGSVAAVNGPRIANRNQWPAGSGDRRHAEGHHRGRGRQYLGSETGAAC